MKYFEVEFEDGYSISCKGIEIPTIEQANVFCTKEVSMYGSVISVGEIDREEVNLFFDTDNIDNWPVFGMG